MCECSGNFLQLDSGISVEQILPRRRIEVYQRFVLRMDHRQMRRNLFQHRYGRRLIINEDPPLTTGSNFAPQDQRAILGIQAVRLQDGFDSTRRRSVALKHRRDHRPLSPRADHIGGRLFPQQQSQRVNQNGLPRPGFAGQKVQTRPRTRSRRCR